MAIVRINTKSGWVDLPDPSEMKITDELVWGSNTGRTQSGTMVGDLKGFKITVECKWNTLKASQMATIRNAIRNAGGFFDIEYIDLDDTLQTMTCYASGIPRQLYSAVPGMKYFQDITVTFIEK